MSDKAARQPEGRRAWRFGCGKKLVVYVPRGWDYKKLEVECGSTAFTGGVNQCAECVVKYPVSEPREDESDLDWFDRQSS
jgi:hypothetical protein